ncbi:hypothetical protein Trco_007815 [Trichoderma cornu-damae]|uniref:Uncharacterized protein n=1 Tax=Trichoderma cornu-damae TaxID=654480 RepID=A0A9P8TTE6_9HYPO|nr:hypothetical protein Trco_007815 [Trichoderma cornu-damae]
MIAPGPSGLCTVHEDISNLGASAQHFCRQAAQGAKTRRADRSVSWLLNLCKSALNQDAVQVAIQFLAQKWSEELNGDLDRVLKN